MKPKIFVAYINLLAWLFNLAYGLTCYSCFLACTSPENCDCTSGTCSGPYCYSRLTSYNGNAHFGLHKGCASQFHGPTGTDCVSDTIDNTADCICNSTDLCNGVELIKTAKNFQLQECCEKTHEDTELCPKTCTG